MIIRMQMILMLGLLASSAGGLSVSTHAKAQQCVSAECACEKALEKNTVEALEEFLKKYQHDVSSQETACAALGVPQDDEGADKRKADYAPAIAQPDELPTE
jgi:hypothetical protein